MVSNAAPSLPRPAFNRPGRSNKPKPEPVVIFQKYFKSVGPRTYAAQVKRASNGNHLLVLTEGKRDEKTGELRKSRVFVYSEDFTEMFKLLKEAAVFIKENPVSPEVKAKRDKFWADGGEAGRKPSGHRASPTAARV